MKWLQRAIGIFIGLLWAKEIDVHGFIMGTVITGLAVTTAILIKKYINSWLTAEDEEFKHLLKKENV